MAFYISRTPCSVFRFTVGQCLFTFVIFSSGYSGVVAQRDNKDYKIVCYYNYWSNYYLFDGKFQVENIDPTLCTHVVYAYVGINVCHEPMLLDPLLQENESNGGREDFLRFIELKRKNPLLKVLVAFGGFYADYGRFHSLLTERNRTTFLSNLRKFIDFYCLDEDTCFDGVSLDYYYPTEKPIPSIYLVNIFLEEIRRMFEETYPGQNKIIAIAASALGTNIKDYYHMRMLSKLADFVSLITYDYHGPTWSNNKTGMIAPLYGRKLETEQESSLNQNATVKTWLNRMYGVDPRKLLLGMPTYGRSFILANNRMTKVGDPTTGAANIGRFTEEPGYLTYNEIVNSIFSNNQNWYKEWDDEQKVPYAYQDNQWISYENEQSFEQKANYIKEMNLGGAVISSIDADNFQDWNFPLIRTVKRVLHGEQITQAKPKTVCYYGSWANHRTGDGHFTPEDINTKLCSHVIYAYTGINEDGGIRILDSYISLPHGLDDFRKFIEMKRYNPEIIMMVGIGGYNEGTSKFSKMAANPQNRQFFIKSVVNFMNTYRFDGVSVDWMHPGGEGGSTSDKQNFVSLLQELRQAFAPHWVLSIIGSASEQVFDRGYDVQGIARYVDFVNLFAMDYHGSWESVTGLNSPLFARTSESGDSRKLNQKYSVEMWMKNGMNVSKLILGIATYGRSFTLQDHSRNRVGAPARGPGQKGPYTQEPGYLAYNELMEHFKHEGSWYVEWDIDANVPFAHREDFWISYDDENSITIKARYIMENGLGGAMIWSLENDDFRGVSGTRFSLISAIKKVFDSGTLGTWTQPPTEAWTTVPPITEPQLPNCTKADVHKNPTDCTTYYICQATTTGFQIVRGHCPTNMGYDDRLKHCIEKDKIPGCH